MAARVLPKIMDKTDIEKLLASPNPKAPTGLRNRAILEVMYRCGLRLSEVVNLKPTHIRWKNGELLVKQGKGKKDRVVPVDGRAMLWLERWKAQRPESDWFFSALKGDKLLPRYLQQMVDREAKAAGLEQKVNPHMLRHTCATELLDEGFTIREVQEFLGHSNVNTTQVYTHVRPKALGDKIRKRGETEESRKDTEEATALLEKLMALPKETREALATALKTA
jgi:integrase/recombinase XerD